MIDTDTLRARLRELLENSELGRSANPENSDLGRMLRLEGMPTVMLYRYYPCSEYALENISVPQITLVSPVKFNDAYDTLPYFDFERSRRELEWLTPEKLADLISKARSGENFTTEEKSWFDRDVDAMELFRRGHKDLKIPPSRQELECMVKKVRDIVETPLENLVRQLQRMVRVACFSERHDSMYMWAHYADNHRGFCVEYEMRPFFLGVLRNISDTEPGGSYVAFLPVVYRKDRYDYSWGISGFFKNLLRGAGGEAICEDYLDRWIHLRTSLFKSDEWEKEREWRLVEYGFNSVPREYRNVPSRPNRIFLGAKMSEEDKTRLTALVRNSSEKELSRVPMLHMTLSGRSREYVAEVSQ